MANPAAPGPCGDTRSNSAWPTRAVITEGLCRKNNGESSSNSDHHPVAALPIVGRIVLEVASVLGPTYRPGHTQPQKARMHPREYGRGMRFLGDVLGSVDDEERGWRVRLFTAPPALPSSS